MAKRVKGRDETIYIRVTPEEKATLIESAKQYELTAAAWLRRVGLGKRNPTPKTDNDAFKALYLEIQYIGRNINQIALKANLGDPISSHCDSVLADLRAALDRIQK